MKKILLLLIVGAAFIYFMFIFAEMSFGQAKMPPPLPSAPKATPIDGGLAILAVAGGAYGIKKLRDKKK